MNSSFKLQPSQCGTDETDKPLEILARGCGWVIVRLHHGSKTSGDHPASDFVLRCSSENEAMHALKACKSGFNFHAPHSNNWERVPHAPFTSKVSVAASQVEMLLQPLLMAPVSWRGLAVRAATDKSSSLATAPTWKPDFKAEYVALKETIKNEVSPETLSDVPPHSLDHDYACRLSKTLMSVGRFHDISLLGMIGHVLRRLDTPGEYREWYLGVASQQQGPSVAPIPSLLPRSIPSDIPDAIAKEMLGFNSDVDWEKHFRNSNDITIPIEGIDAIFES